MDTEPEPDEAGTVIVNLALDPALFERAAQRLGGKLTNRDVISRAVQVWLPLVVAQLREAGMSRGPMGKRRPRRLDARTWQALAEAEQMVSAGRPDLLRACLTLMADKGLPEPLRTETRPPRSRTGGLSGGRDQPPS